MSDLSVSDAQIQDALAPYYEPIDQTLCDGIRLYISTLLLWNSKMSLTTVTKPEEILRTHFGESLFATRVAGISTGRVADIGTGPGFPGIPIRMVSPDVRLTLVEAVAKKIAFLGEVVRKLALSNVDIIRYRMEEFKPPERFSFITARALGQYEILLGWASEQLSVGGRAVLLLGEKEVSLLVQNPRWEWNTPVAIPGSAAKFVLLGAPVPR